MTGSSIKIAEWLVDEHHRRCHGQRPRERDPLALASGEQRGVAVGLLREADEREARVDLTFVHTAEPQLDGEADIPPCGAASTIVRDRAMA